jgi:cytochrome c556
MKGLAYVTILGLAAGSIAFAHESATGVVKTRMEEMERFEELIERVFAMINGELSYEAAAVRRAAEEIRNRAGGHLTSLFPEGSNDPPSEARTEIWLKFRDFDHYAFMLERWSGELATQADERPHGTLPAKWEDAEMGPAMMQRGGMMGRRGPDFAAWHVAATCNACHAEFREEE